MAEVSLSRRMARAARQLTIEQLPPEVRDKVKIALLDFLSCAYEARDLPWGCQAIQRVSRAAGGTATVIGTPFRVAAAEAAFANATLGHGLVREDMHTGAVSHLGVVIFPTLLALAQQRRVTGGDFMAAVVCGYEVGAAVGRALMDQEIVRRFRPTGITGPLGGAAAGSRLFAFSEDATVGALGFAANATGGLNEWPYCGGDEMFFHPGFSARNAVTAVELAELGALASETALDGRAGLFAGLGRSDKVDEVTAFTGKPFEILSVYHKPAPACNYAQTACQAALALSTKIESREIESITVKASAAAAGYPGCDFAGPFERILQAKMSIQYCVAATLARRAIEEANYRQLADPKIARLASITQVEADAEFTAAYPEAQGAEVIVTARDGRTVRYRMEDLRPASPEEIRARFRTAAGAAAEAIEVSVDRLEEQEDIGALNALLGT
ncbi:MAG TPA: MmgE/PrpD family protein [Bryobacteraceae bacterium]